MSTRQPPADRPVTGNLQPYTPPGWSGPLVVSNHPTRRTHEAVFAGSPAYLSWAHHNAGPRAINSRYHVDVYLNDVLVERWRSDGADTRGYRLIEGWMDIPQRVRLQTGTHRLRLVLDPLDEVAETDETDNVYEVMLSVSGGASSGPSERSPDLAFVTPKGWDAPVVVNSYEDRSHDGPLSVDATTHIRYAFANQGPVSVLRPVPVHVYLDGIMVREQVWESALAGQTITDAPWAGLLDTVRLTPGQHTLRVVLDPGNLIIEDTTNNVWEETFAWNGGPVVSAPLLPLEPAPVPPPAVAKPDLTPSWRFGWGGPITLSTARENFTGAPMVAGQRPYVSLVVWDQSVHAAGPFSADLYFDGELVHTRRFRGALAGGSITWAEWDGLLARANPQPGPHTLRMVIDPGNEVDEWDEGNNVYETIVQWHAAAPPAPAPRTYTDAQLREMLSGLPQLLDDQRPVVSAGGGSGAGTLMAMAEAGYYLMTGESFLDRPQAVHLLSHEDYIAWVNASFLARFATTQPSEHAGLLEARERFKSEILGMKTRHEGVVTVVVDAERPFAEVLNTLVHEMGHARQDFLNPAQPEAGSSHYLSGVQEAQAQQFERAFWLHIGEFLDVPLLSYPRHRAFESLIDAHFDNWYANRMAEEHDLGYLLAWTAALVDTSIDHLGDALIENSTLNASQALDLYHHLVGLDAVVADDYVEARMPLISDALVTMKTLAKRRLAAGLGPDLEGSEHLRIPGLMLP